MSKVSDFLLKNTNMAYMTIAFTGICILLYSVTYLLNFQYHRLTGLKWKGLKFDTRNLAIIAMMIAVSVSTTVVISVTIPITVFPPIRVAFSGIMVKITGLFFGPIVGLIVGILTECICLMFVPSYIHIAYFCVSLSFGFWAGVASYTLKWRGKKIWLTFGLITAYMVAFTLTLFTIEMNNPNINDTLFMGIKISGYFAPYMFLIMMGITLLIIWTITLGLLALRKQRWLEIVLPIILLCIITETLATILLASWGDSQILGIPSYQGGYSSMILIRLFQTPIKITFNTAVLSTVYMVMKPIIKTKQ
ncbi:hypothetical protein JN01_0077 [Entomoplasma freundtii]|uniref:Uncharacterized protein n=1 Tax=Entomoplasma freundtii TaxID=74700 RepID=A0A2K8NVC6_9MOLU|nr:hypothetical protein [Entomoplasma freundtii]ATZ16701.1 hypothetical protein EFREU_v1c06810 [Entomoplasma freundtii]TDY58132.1 hypothetical protein JN01_0077 [Entomoplasma freundtii]